MVASRPATPAGSQPAAPARSRPAIPVRSRLVTSARSWLATLVDLVLPAECAGCGGRCPWQVCPACAARLAAASPAATRPRPAPPGLPPTMAIGGYAGPLRSAILAYKERGRHRLATLLGDRLADVVAAAVPGAGPVLLVPVPATAAAVRRRHGDHMARLAARAAAALRGRGRWAAVAQPLLALPRPDSAGLGAAARLVTAGGAFALRPRRVAELRVAVDSGGAAVVLVDDVVTTGATLAAAACRLRAAGVAVDAAAVLAATARRPVPASAGTQPVTVAQLPGHDLRHSVSGGWSTPGGVDDHPGGGDLENRE